METNPITQRCITISKEHHFEQMKRVGYYFAEDGGRYAQDQFVYMNNKIAFKCKACDLVDDLYGGIYK